MKKSEKEKLIKTVEIVFKRNGQNVGTYSPHCAIEDTEKYDLSKKEQFCRSYDDNYLIEENTYFIKEIVLPIWLNEKEYCENTNYVYWNYIWQMNNKIPYMAENIQRYLYDLMVKNYGFNVYCMSFILQVKRFKSKFRESMYNQIIDHINTPQEDRKYRLSLSPKQLNCISVKKWQYDNVSKSIYWAKRNGIIL